MVNYVHIKISHNIVMLYGFFERDEKIVSSSLVRCSHQMKVICIITKYDVFVGFIIYFSILNFAIFIRDV